MAHNIIINKFYLRRLPMTFMALLKKPSSTQSLTNLLAMLVAGNQVTEYQAKEQVEALRTDTRLHSFKISGK